MSIALSKKLLLCLSLVLIASCGGGSGGGANTGDTDLDVLLSLPLEIGGKSISFTVTSGTGDSVADGLTIIYEFSDDGKVFGTNPVSGNKYLPDGYSYSSDGTTATVRLAYDSVKPGGYEEYTLTPQSCEGNKGDYDSVASVGIANATATGTYSILVDECLDEGAGVFNAVAELEPNDTEGTAQNVASGDLVAGSVDYNASNASGNDRQDVFAYTAVVNSPNGAATDHIATLSYQGGSDDINLSIDDNSVSVINSVLVGPDGKVVKFIYIRMHNGETAYVTVEGNNTGGIADYNFVVTNEKEDATAREFTTFVGGVWDITETIQSNTCGFANVAEPVYQATIQQTGRILSITSSVTSTLVGKVFIDEINKTFVSWSGSYAYKGGTLTLSEVRLQMIRDGQSQTRDPLSGTASWTWSDGATNCGGEMQISASPVSLVSSAPSGVAITTEPGSPVVACCTIRGPLELTALEKQNPGSQVSVWALGVEAVTGPPVVVEWEVTVENGPTVTSSGNDTIFYKMFTQAADWKITVTDTGTLAKTTFTGRVEPLSPTTANGQFAEAEPYCLENFPVSICNAIGDPGLLGLPASEYSASSFSGSSLTCAGLGYNDRESSVMSTASPGADPTSTCTYRE